MQPLGYLIQKEMLPTLTGQSAPDQTTKSLLALPPRLGGTGIQDPSANWKLANLTTKKVTKSII